MGAKKSGTKWEEALEALVETDLLIPLCGRVIQRRRVGPPGKFMLYRPMGDECEGCERGGTFYLQDAVTGEKRGPVCLVRPVSSAGGGESGEAVPGVRALS